jgi:hypothetical protein
MMPRTDEVVAAAAEPHRATREGDLLGPWITVSTCFDFSLFSVRAIDPAPYWPHYGPHFSRWILADKLGRPYTIYLIVR